MLFFSALKLMLGGFLKAIGEFISANWRWVLPLVAALLLFWYVTNLQHERDEAIAALKDYERAAVLASEQRKAENFQKAEDAHRVLTELENTHAADINKIRSSYEKVTKADANTIALWRERVRLEVARAAAGLPPLPEPSTLSAEGGGDSDPALAGSPDVDGTTGDTVIERACAITTSDYNALWSSWDKACQVYGCTK